MEKSDIFDALKIPMQMLKVTGSWPKYHKTPTYQLKQIISWVIDITFFCTLLIELRLNIVEKDYKHLTELISFMASPTSYIFKHLIFLLNRNKFLIVLDRLKQPVFNNYPIQSDIHIKNSIKFATIIIRFFQFLVINLVILYLLKPWFTKDNSAIRFEAYDLGKFRIPYHLFQVASIGLACWNNSTLDVLGLSLISIGAAQFQILRDKLLHIREWAGLLYEEVDIGKVTDDLESITDEIDNKINKRLKECVKHHMAIIEYAGEIENIYTYYFLIQFFDSVIAICNTWFQFMLADDILNIIFLVFYSATLVTQLGMYCLYGNNIMLKSAEIRDACYLSTWYYCGKTVKSSLMIIMERSKRPTVLTAGKFSVLGLASFSSLMQNSYSYFALMNRLYGQ